MLLFGKSSDRYLGLESLAGSRQQAISSLSQGRRDDVVAIVFTSGTTGPAKGVSIAYSALAFQVCTSTLAILLLED